jgi:hypothetical protein
MDVTLLAPASVRSWQVLDSRHKTLFKELLSLSGSMMLILFGREEPVSETQTIRSYGTVTGGGSFTVLWGAHDLRNLTNT